MAATPPSGRPTMTGDTAVPPRPVTAPWHLIRGRTGDPPWVRPSAAALLTGTGLLYLLGGVTLYDLSGR